MSVDTAWIRNRKSHSFVIFEIVTGTVPFAPEIPSQADLYKRVALQGERPRIPNTVRGRWSRLMQQCWATDPRLRPTMAEVVKTLQTLFSNWAGLDLSNFSSAPLYPSMVTGYYPCLMLCWCFCICRSFPSFARFPCPAMMGLPTGLSNPLHSIDPQPHPYL